MHPLLAPDTFVSSQTAGGFRHRTSFAAMLMSKAILDYEADSLIARLGWKARQFVVNEIVVAVTNHDLAMAKY